MARHPGGDGEKIDPPAVVIEDEAGDDDQEEDCEAVEVDSAVAHGSGEEDVPERLVDQIGGEHGAQHGESKNPPVAGDRREHDAYEETDHGVGEEVHRYPVAGRAYTLFPVRTGWGGLDPCSIKVISIDQ